MSFIFFVLFITGIIHAADQALVQNQQPAYTLRMQIGHQRYTCELPNWINQPVSGIDGAVHQVQRINRNITHLNQESPSFMRVFSFVWTLGIGLGLGLFEPEDIAVNALAILTVLDIDEDNNAVI